MTYRTAEDEKPESNCPLCSAVENEKRLSYFTSDNEMGDGDWFYILPAKNKKGHMYRFMVVNKFHREPMVPQDGINLLFQFMSNLKQDFVILSPTHASIPDHWHILACSLDKGTDEALIADTDRMEIRFVKRSGNLVR